PSNAIVAPRRASFPTDQAGRQRGAYMSKNVPQFLHSLDAFGRRIRVSIFNRYGCLPFPGEDYRCPGITGRNDKSYFQIQSLLILFFLNEKFCMLGNQKMV
ncbi:MAG: hypothetical protein WBW71_11465, partial [Bacteroidota bacterium]